MSAPARASVVGSVLWAGLESGLSLAISVGAVLAIARLLGAAEFGLGSLAHGLVQIPLVLVGSLVHDALVQRADLSEAHWRAGRVGSLVAGAALALAAAASAPLLGALFGEPRLAALIVAFAPLLLLEAVSAPLLARRRRGLDFAGVTRRLVLGRGLGAAVGVAVAALGGAAWAIVAQQLVASATIALLLQAGAPRLPRGPVDRRALQELLGFCRPIALTQLVIQGSERLFLAYVGLHLSLAAAGCWSLAVRLVENIASVVMSALYHVGLAFLSRLQGDRAALLERLDGAVRLLMLAAVPPVAALLVVADLLIEVVVGPGWTEAAPAVQILALGVLLLLRRLLPAVALTAAGRPHANLDAYLLENGLVLPALFLLGPVALPAVAALRAVRAAIGHAVIGRAAARALGRGWRSELAGLARDAAALLAGCLVGLSMRELAARAATSELAALVACALASVLAAAAVALLLQPSFARDLLRRGRRLLGRPLAAAPLDPLR